MQEEKETGDSEDQINDLRTQQHKHTPLSPYQRLSRLQPTVCLLNPAYAPQNNIPKSAPVTPSHMRPHQLFTNTHNNTNRPSVMNAHRSVPCTPIHANTEMKNETNNVIMSENPIPNGECKTIIIFDWDDTLLPSYHLQELGLRPRSNYKSNHQPTILSERDKSMICESLKKLEQIINVLLVSALDTAGYGNVFVVTNAEEGWVELSCSTFIPNIRKMLSKCRVISARSLFEHQCPSTIEWKRRAFKMILDQVLNTSVNIKKVSLYAPQEDHALNTVIGNGNIQRSAKGMDVDTLHVVSFGDSLVERQAIFDVTRCITFKENRVKHVKTKSIKLLQIPTINQLIDELQTIQNGFVSIIQHPEDLDYQVQR
eukprot:495389_1